MFSSKWKVDRGQLNHNWLQNEILVAMNNVLSVLGRAVRSQAPRHMIATNVLRWEERSAEVALLLARFENEMSPKVYFDCVPLCRCSDETKRWLLPLTHEIWLQRHNVKERVAEAQGNYEKAESAFQAVKTALDLFPESTDIEVLQSLDPHIRAFAKACEALSKSISALPHEIVP